MNAISNDDLISILVFFSYALLMYFENGMCVKKKIRKSCFYIAIKFVNSLFNDKRNELFVGLLYGKNKLLVGIIRRK